jgi:hypothetical protein
VQSEARERFDRGLELYREGDYAVALVEFQRAYELVPNYRVLYNVGQVSIQLGQYARARLALQQYLEGGGSEVSGARRRAVATDLRMLETRTALLSLEVNVADAEVLVDDVALERVQLQAPLLVDAGAHRITARHPDYLPEALKITLAGGDRRSLSLVLRDRPLAQTIVVREPSRQVGALVIGGWVATGVLAAGAIFTGVMGAGKVRDWEEIRKWDELLVPNLASRIDDARSSARSFLLISDVLSGAAVLAGGFSLWMTLRSESDAAPAGDLNVGFEAGRVTLAGRF